ncbi:MAG TPA: hypothetical protein VIR57_10055, partial [Chloroflexota bacterium]
MAERTTQAVQPPDATEPAPRPHSDDILDRQTDQIVERAAQVGQERLDRSPADILITTFIGGVDVSLGALAAMLVVGAALNASPGIGLY